jgi:hypothetical protein
VRVSDINRLTKGQGYGSVVVYRPVLFLAVSSLVLLKKFNSDSCGAIPKSRSHRASHEHTTRRTTVAGWREVCSVFSLVTQ